MIMSEKLGDQSGNNPEIGDFNTKPEPAVAQTPNANKYQLTPRELNVLHMFNIALHDVGATALLLLQLATNLAHDPAACAEAFTAPTALDMLGSLFGAFGGEEMSETPEPVADDDGSERFAMQQMVQATRGADQAHDPQINLILSALSDRCSASALLTTTVLSALSDVIGNEPDGFAPFDSDQMVEAAISLRMLSELARQCNNPIAFPEGSIPSDALLQKIERVYTVHYQRELAISMGADPDSLKSLQRLDDVDAVYVEHSNKTPANTDN